MTVLRHRLTALPRALPRTVLVPAASLALVVVAAVPGAALPYDEGLSEPREDSYYPDKGDPGVDVLHYGLDLDWRRAERTLHGVATLDVRVTAAADHVQLDLIQAMDVSAVTVDGAPVEPSHDGNDLVVPLGATVPADSRHQLVITYAGTPRKVGVPTTRSDMQSGVGMTVTDDGQLWTMQEPWGAHTWYPANDHPSDKALYDLTVEVPAGWRSVANGTPTELPANGDRPVTSWHLRDPAAAYLVTLAVGPYAHRTDTGPRGLPLNFYVPRTNTAKWMKPLRRTAEDLRWLEERLGRYPFESAGAVVVPGDSAMETQTMVTFGRREYRWRDVRRTMVHEYIHQWYGDTVTPDDWTGLWLNEGMATYLEARWTTAFRNVPWPAWAGYFADLNPELRQEDGPPAAYKRGHFAEACVYYCTAAMFEALRKKIGNRPFWRLVRQWPQTHRNENVNRRIYVRWVEQQTGRELSAFFRRWLFKEEWN